MLLGQPVPSDPSSACVSTYARNTHVVLSTWHFTELHTVWWKPALLSPLVSSWWCYDKCDNFLGREIFIGAPKITRWCRKEYLVVRHQCGRNDQKLLHEWARWDKAYRISGKNTLGEVSCRHKYWCYTASSIHCHDSGFFPTTSSALIAHFWVVLHFVVINWWNSF